MFYSAETAMLRVINDALREINSGYEVVLVLLDLSAAFDMIDHTLLTSFKFHLKTFLFQKAFN